MKYLVLLLISFYKTVVSPFLKLILGTQSMCRFTPSCSQYAENVIKQYGVFTGSMMFLKRFLQCQPFTPHPNPLPKGEGNWWSLPQGARE